MFGADPRAARVAWTVFLVAGALWIAYLARQTLFILILAVFLAYLLYPLVHALQRYARGIPRGIAVGIVFLAVSVVIAVASISIGERVSEQATSLTEKLPALLKDPDAAGRIPLPHWMEPLRGRIVQTLREQLGGSSDHALPLVQRVGVGVLRVAGNLIYLVVIPILAFFLLKDAARLRGGAMQLLVPGPKRSMWEAIVDDLNTILGGYVRALLLLSLAAFCAYALVFSLLGVPYALVIAAIAGPLEFIPVLGPLAAALVAVLVAAFSGYDHLTSIVVFLAAYRLFQDYVLSPYLMSEEIELHPVLVIIGILGGEQIGGVPGMFLAVPLLAAARLFMQKVRSTANALPAGARPIMHPTDPS
ncbi:MAG TPA: AI-2E family transporter [Burkholderiales bacterium]|nr:AI-2E family transporter [Burkholderiales bacterium]